MVRMITVSMRMVATVPQGPPKKIREMFIVD
jgi:hypothetical protein